MLIKFKRLKEIDEIYGKLLKFPNFKQTKLEYAFKKFSKQTIPYFKEYKEELEDIKVSNALTDKNSGEILYTDNRMDYKYNIDGMKNLLKLSRELNSKWDGKDIEVEPFICAEYPDGLLDEMDAEVLEGIIIKSNE